MIFFADLDNTIIYSHKHDIGDSKRNVELYQGREISFITDHTYELLKNVKEKMLVVPTSTRTIEQYRRINLGVGNFRYALVCNGGILLQDGEKVEGWYCESLERIEESIDELNLAMKLLEIDSRRNFELRFIENLFVFTKCGEPEQVVYELRNKLDISKVDVFNNGIKVYVVPKQLNKGIAIKRFMDYIGEDYAIAAGDSEFDISMLKEANTGLVPSGFSNKFAIDFSVEEMAEDRVFSEALLERCLDISGAGQ